MNAPKLSDELSRFIYTIASVPHLEAILLLHQPPIQSWDENTIAKRLYLNAEQVNIMLMELCAAGICKPVPDVPSRFIYAPAFSELNDLIDQLVLYYSLNLIEVTNIIHSKTDTGRRASLFADAFKFRKDK